MRPLDLYAMLSPIRSGRAARKAVALGRKHKARRRAEHQNLNKEVQDALAQA